jgi:hypothetical protein
VETYTLRTPQPMTTPSSVATTDAVHGRSSTNVTATPISASPAISSPAFSALSFPNAPVLPKAEKAVHHVDTKSPLEKDLKLDIEHQEVEDDPRKWSSARKVRHLGGTPCGS